jgi:hypothetical protein
MARKTADPELHAADNIWGSRLHVKENFHNIDPHGGTHSKFGIRHHYHKQIFLLLDIQRSYDASLNLGHQTMHFADEDVTLWSPGLVVTNGHVIPAQCAGVVMDRPESPLGVESGLIEQSPEAHAPETAKRYQDATRRHRKLKKGAHLAQCEPVTLVAASDVEQSQAGDTTLKPQDVMVVARPKLSEAESRE